MSHRWPVLGAGLIAAAMLGPAQSSEYPAEGFEVAIEPVLAADFDDLPLGEIDNGGAVEGQPAYRYGSFSAAVIAGDAGDQALELTKTDDSTLMRALNWRFLQELSVDAGTVSVSFDVTPRTFDDFSFSLSSVNFTGARYVQLDFHDDGTADIALPGGGVVWPASYSLDESHSVLIVCDLASASCSVQLDDHVLTESVPFPGSISDPAIGGFASTFPGTAGNAARFEIDNLTITAEEADSIPVALVFDQQPVDTVVDAAMDPAVSVAVRNAFGDVAPVATPLSLSLVGGAAGAALSGGQAVSSDGIATFDTLSVSETGTAYRLQATLDDYPDIDAVDSSEFDVLAPGPAALEFSSMPGRAVFERILPVPVEVRVLDAGGQPVIDPVEVTLTVQAGPEGGEMLGTTVQTSVQGLAVFGDLFFTEPGPYWLRATTPEVDLPADAAPLMVLGDRIFQSRMEYVAPPN